MSFSHSIIGQKHRGSALLIVLGMIAFMVVSAVAFSALMRHSRLPSSYLRRTSSSRHLVKAALAEAIDLVDIAIGNDRYPGAGDSASRSWASPRDAVNGQTQSFAKRNHWRGHVFIGTNQLCSADDTVSTLTLEGLAYLPPALINEARYYSRRSVAGFWRNLGFDAGRYAFCAVDVSDHFDVNRVFADRGRNSSDSGRVTLAHVFENKAHTGDGNPSAANWDDFVARFNDAVDAPVGQKGQNQGSTKLPFTSLADLNLAINKEQPGWTETMSPFCRFIRNGTSFVTGLGGEDSERIRQMTFVTDSYTPSTNDANSAKYDLCSAQPFGRMRTGKTKSSQMSYMDQLAGTMSTPILTRLYDKVTELDTVSLYDYLDENDVPTSLALPSVEAVPMICALKPSVNFGLELLAPSKTTDPSPAPAKPSSAADHYWETRTYKLRMSNPVGQVEAKCLFPFRHCGDQAVTFKFDVAVRIGFTTGDGPGFRQANGGFVIADESSFKLNEVRDGIIRLYQEAPTQLSFNPKDIDSEEKAISQNITADLTSRLNTIRDSFNDDANGWLFKVTYRYDAEPAPPGSPDPFVWKTQPVIDTARPPQVNTAFFHPTAENGSGDGGFNVQYLINQLSTCVVRPYMTVTARIVSNQSQATVDLVPAHYADDQGFNGLNTPSEVGAVCGNLRPFITMVGGDAFAFAEGSFGGTTVNVGFAPSAGGGMFVCPDPRWNFAPENFYVMEGSALPNAQTFVQNCDLEKNGRDCDIFMMCSNQGYMQSPSEFAFLPRTTTARLPVAGSQFGSAAANPNGRTDGYPASAGVAPYDKLAHGNLMWRTYQAFAREGIDDDNLYDLGLTCDGCGPRVDPYTSSRDVMMAALANTPVSWWAASTNLTANNNLAEEDSSAFNRDYAFCERNSKAKIAWKDLQKVADRFLSIFRTGDGNWEREFHNQDWDGEQSDLCGVDFDSTDADTVLKDVDRKMLYGFWRDSFAQKQQLFLIFVRAEPMMMGGGSIGQTPPQLGARAVALVWRDPNPTLADIAGGQPRPHRTRVLFYRQFD